MNSSSQSKIITTKKFSCLTNILFYYISNHARLSLSVRSKENMTENNVFLPKSMNKKNFLQ